MVKAPVRNSGTRSKGLPYCIGIPRHRLDRRRAPL